MKTKNLLMVCIASIAFVSCGGGGGGGGGGDDIIDDDEVFESVIPDDVCNDPTFASSDACN